MGKNVIIYVKYCKKCMFEGIFGLKDAKSYEDVVLEMEKGNKRIKAILSGMVYYFLLIALSIIFVIFVFGIIYTLCFTSGTIANFFRVLVLYYTGVSN